MEQQQSKIIRASHVGNSCRIGIIVSGSSAMLGCHGMLLMYSVGCSSSCRRRWNWCRNGIQVQSVHSMNEAGGTTIHQHGGFLVLNMPSGRRRRCWACIAAAAAIDVSMNFAIDAFTIRRIADGRQQGPNTLYKFDALVLISTVQASLYHVICIRIAQKPLHVGMIDNASNQQPSRLFARNSNALQ